VLRLKIPILSPCPTFLNPLRISHSGFSFSFSSRLLDPPQRPNLNTEPCRIKQKLIHTILRHPTRQSLNHGPSRDFIFPSAIKPFNSTLFPPQYSSSLPPKPDPNPSPNPRPKQNPNSKPKKKREIERGFVIVFVFILLSRGPT
jgi:hypothetical protein